jgi:hypothetical protein
LVALFAKKSLQAIFGVLQHYPLQSGRWRNGLIKVALDNATSSAAVTLTG